MRILGIDYGERRTGLALSDPLGLTAQPLPTIQGLSDTELIGRIEAIVLEKEVEEIVVGFPRNMNGTVGRAGKRVMEFVGKLKAQVACPVSTEDERLTTMMSDRVLAAHGVKPKDRKAKLDRMAAQFILQAHLDRRHSAEDKKGS